MPDPLASPSAYEAFIRPNLPFLIEEITQQVLPE